jgi:hypothetical protein
VEESLIDATLINSVDPTASDVQDGTDEEVENYAELDVNGQAFDLTSKENAEQALSVIRDYRQQLKNNALDEYEERSTEFGKGGRSKLMYDELRADLAVRYWNGEHQLDWEEQHEAAENIRSIRAIQAKESGLWK